METIKGTFVPRQEQLSLRDYFAGQAMVRGVGTAEGTLRQGARGCYLMADAMIDEHNKTKKGGDQKMAAGIRRKGKPRTEKERQTRHKKIYGTEKTPSRGSGLKNRR